MAENNTVWNTIFSRDGRVFYEPNEDMPGFTERLRAQKAQKLLDLGCGTGRHLVFFRKAGFDMYGLDQAPRAIELAKQWLVEEGLQANLRQGNMLEPLPYPDAFFDGIISIAVIHHTLLGNIKAIIAEMHRVLKPGGLIYVSVPLKDRENDDDHPANEIEPDTFVPLQGSEKGLPHHMFTEATLREAFSSFTILETHISSRKHHVCITAKKIE